MPTDYPEIRKFDGLYLQTNSFNVPDGALEQALNVNIIKDNRISKRRGFYQYDAPVSTLNNLAKFQDQLMGIFTDGIGYYTDSGVSPNETGSLTTNTGTSVSITSGRISRSIQANKNFYFTTDDGTRKLETYDGKVFSAGIAPALDLSGNFTDTNTGAPIPGNSQVAYRVVFGRRDANENLLLGAPSDILILVNPFFDTATYTSSGATITVDTGSAHGYSVGMVITASDAADTALDGTWTITAVTSTTFDFTATGAPSPTSGDIKVKADRIARIEASIPSEIDNATDEYFVQIYRSTASNSESATPTPDFKIVDERQLTSAEISANVLYYEDIIPSILRGAELYTNPNSREGEAQANFRPPLADDVTFYKNHAVYAGVTSRHLFELDVIDTTPITDGDYIEISVDATTRRYVARDGVGNTTVTSESVSGTGTITITYTAHGLLNGDDVYISNVSGTVPDGIYTVSNVAPNTFDITSGGNSATELDFFALRNTSGYYLFSFDTSSTSVAVQLQTTAKQIIKAINRDDSSPVYAQYTSGVTDIPGQMRLLSKSFGGAIQIAADSAATGDAFSPTLTTTATDNQSTNDDNPNQFFMSKISEPEAVPLVNFFSVGSRNASILRVEALRDSIIVLKEDGVFRVTGDTVGSITVTTLDSTVICVAPSSVDVINNQVIFLSNQGVCLVTESSVQIISRRIEDVIQPILGRSTLAANTFGVAYESERLFLLTTLKPNSTSETVVYAYNILNGTWTTWDTVFVGGVIDARDRLHIIDTNNDILRERKNQTRVDYCGQNYTATVSSVASDNLSCVITTSGSYVPQEGDVIVKDDVFNRITSVSIDGVNYTVSFPRATNLEAADVEILYAAYESGIKLSPFHAGLVGRMKQFSQMQIHQRSNATSRVKISFTGYTYGGSLVVDWQSDSSSGGWGFEPWGFFPWGQEDGVDVAFESKPAPVIRIYVPLFQQRSTYVQPVIEHSEAGESLEIQAIAFAVRAYQERVSV